MNFSLIICTYMRPKPLLALLESVRLQTLYPNEILIVDGSTNDDTKITLTTNSFNNLTYFKVDERDRGLTKQRNFGIRNVALTSEIICFLDDDIILEFDYFEKLIGTYNFYPEALGVGGYIINDTHLEYVGDNYVAKKTQFYFDGWVCEEPSRFRMRRFFGLLPDAPPGFMPTFSHGRSVGFLPPSGKIYEVEQLMGGVSSYKKEVFDKMSFSTYFEGYGLYEDADFSLRLAKQGKLYVNTKAQLSHHHDASGRPNQYLYGKMVLRNGWYVWRIKFPNPTINARFKWHATAVLLIVIRILNIFNTSKRKEALMESLGRVVGLVSLYINKPKIDR